MRNATIFVYNWCQQVRLLNIPTGYKGKALSSSLQDELFAEFLDDEEGREKST